MKKGIKITNCLNKKIDGFFKWLIKLKSVRPDLFNPYEIVTKLFSDNQIKWGINNIKEIIIDNP